MAGLLRGGGAAELQAGWHASPCGALRTIPTPPRIRVVWRSTARHANAGSCPGGQGLQHIGRRLGAAQGDHTTGINAVAATLAALRLRDLTGEGQVAAARLDTHPEWLEWKGRLQTGEFWATVGEDWVGAKR